MTYLNSGELLQVVIDALRERTDSVLFLKGSNPFSLSVDGRQVTLFIANVSHARRDDSDEYRIQCPGNLPEVLTECLVDGSYVGILGYNSESDTFSAWDPNAFVSRNRGTQRFSLYTRLTNHKRARANGFAVYRDAVGQHVLAFRAELLGLYVANMEPMHRATERALHNMVGAYESSRADMTSRRMVTVARRKVDVSHRQYARSPAFREAVLKAYDFSCAMCDIQLELIEAAHLVPHAHPKGVDAVRNGIALCALHHRALDTGLLYVNVNYEIEINAIRRRYLTKMRRLCGFRRFTRQLRQEIALPENSAESPSRRNIALGNRLRGIGVE